MHLERSLRLLNLSGEIIKKTFDANWNIVRVILQMHTHAHTHTYIYRCY